MISKFIRSLTNIGIDSSYSLFDKSIVRTTNTFALISVPTFILFIILDFFNSVLVLIYFLMMMLTSATILFNYFKKHTAASYYIIYVLLAQYCTLYILFGSGLGMEPLFFLHVFGSIYMFYRKKEIYLIVFSIVLCYLLVSFLRPIYFGPPQFHPYTITPYILFILPIIIMTSLATSKFREIVKHTQTKNYALQELQDINQALVKNEKLILDQKTELELTNEQLEKYAFVASHDLKTPIRSIKSFLDLSKIKLKQGDIKKVEEYYTFMSKSATHMSNLVDDLLAFSKLDNQKIFFEKTDLNKLLKSVIELLQAEKSFISDTLPTAVVNPVQFQLIFQNLIQNGLKYNESEHPLVKIKYHRHADTHVMTFTDNGLGIEKQYKDDIFQMFSRLHTAHDYEGTGLGLSICHKIMIQHSGKIILKDSVFGQGSTFEMSWPVSVPPSGSLEV